MPSRVALQHTPHLLDPLQQLQNASPASSLLRLHSEGLHARNSQLLTYEASARLQLPAG